MKKSGLQRRKSRKHGAGYWQKREWIRKSFYRRLYHYLWNRRRSITLIAAGLIIGGAIGSFVFDRNSRSLSFTQLREIWERYKPTVTSDREASRPPKGWEEHYRRPPESGRPPYYGPRPDAEQQTDARPNRFPICASTTRIDCIVDGDTIWYRGNKIRIADIDTPEIFSAKCASEKARGERAMYRLQELLNAGPFQVVAVAGAPDKDRHGRLLRVIMRDGRSLGMILVKEGLARVWDGRKRPWC